MTAISKSVAGRSGFSRLLKNSTRLAGWHVIPWI
jgi:hypothetical protein